jgi:hypothetical protein
MSDIGINRIDINPQGGAAEVYKRKETVNKEFQEILAKEQKKLSGIAHEKPTSASNKALAKIQKSLDKSEVGMELALKKQLKEYSIALEKHIYSSMWQAAYTSAKEKNSGMAETLYGSQYMSQLVSGAYGEEGGPLAESVYEKLVLDYGQDFGGSENGEKGVDKKL